MALSVILEKLDERIAHVASAGKVAPAVGSATATNPGAAASALGGPTAKNPNIRVLSSKTVTDALNGASYVDSLEAVRLCWESHIEKEFPRSLPQLQRPCCFRLVFENGCRPTAKGKDCPRCNGRPVSQLPEAQSQVKAIKAVFKGLSIAESFA